MKDCNWSRRWLHNWLFTILYLFQKLLWDDSNRFNYTINNWCYPKAIQKINLTANIDPEGNTKMFFIIEKLCSMIFWLWHQIVSSSFSCHDFYVSVFSNIFRSFSKNSIIPQLKKIFFKISLVFIPIYGFSQAFWLNLITLWTFFKTNLFFNACFKFLMCKTYSVFIM